MPAVPSENFLVSKAGPLPVWGWGAVGLGVAYGWSRYKANKAAKNNPSADAGTSGGQFTYGAGQPVSGAPTYLIENNIPGFGSVPSTPVVTPPTPTPPVVTPPSTTPTPPTTAPPSQPSGAVPGQAVQSPGPIQAPPAPHVPRITGSTTHRVMAGDSYSKIASEYHLPGGWQQLYAYNTNPQYNSAYATFARQGPNLLYANQTIHVPVYS